MWNTFGAPDVFRHKIAVLDEHCRRIGRDPDAIEKSVLIAGGPNVEEVRRQIEEYVAVGVTHIIYSLSAPYDRQMLRRFAHEVIPAFR
jgi:alkanesulfonate monooxygenase SsuD/methylene tetrahydromethanopterin reductase-like flavin-dependent oxidoreductase (luciferase family)